MKPEIIPADQKLNTKNAFYSLILAPMEYVTNSLRKGDPWELADLEPFVRRCEALSLAFRERMERAGK